MKVNLLRKNLKFALFLSLSSLMGLQAGQAENIMCPRPENIQLNNSIFYGTTSGAREIMMKSEPVGEELRIKPTFYKRRGATVANEALKCHYQVPNVQNAFRKFILTAPVPKDLTCTRALPRPGKSTKGFVCHEK